jgi:Plasmid pRiA4b ORF-3-like protein
MACAAGHQEAGAVAAAVAALAESGAALTAAQAVDLKVTLWRSSPPLWRTVRMPLAATLGDLHRAIQVLFDWDGDHLHAFTVADVRYSDPFFDLEETASEEAVRLRDAFPASARKPVRYEYDLSAGWVHEVTRTGSSRLAPEEAVPRCLSFSVSRAPGQRVTMTVAWCPAAFLSLTSPVSSSQPSASASAI